jgi:hypothetical protein
MKMLVLQMALANGVQQFTDEVFENGVLQMA